MLGNFQTGWDGSICDEQHIAEALHYRFNHEVIRVQRESYALAYHEKDIDFTLIAQWNGYPEDLVSKLPKPVVYWAFDYQDDGQDWHERLVAGADLYLSKPFKDSKYPNWRWLSQDFAPEFLDRFSPAFEEAKDIEVLFTGSWVPWESGKQRVEYLKAIDKEFNLQINSVTPDQWKAEGFKNVHGPVMDQGLPALISRAKVNFSMDHVISPGYWSDRNAQIMACGGFVLFKYVPLSESRFHDNIGYFWDIKSCLENIQHWLEVEEDREAFADNGYEYAQEYLKVNNRVDDLITIVRSIL